MNEKIYQVAIPELPEGWKAVAFRVAEHNEFYMGKLGIDRATDDWPDRPPSLIVQKIQPRRIVLDGQASIYKGKLCDTHMGWREGHF